MKIRAHVSMGLQGCKKTEVLDIEDDLSDVDIDEIVKDWMFKKKRRKLEKEK